MCFKMRFELSDFPFAGHGFFGGYLLGLDGVGKSRRFKHGTLATVMTIVFVAAVVLVNVIATMTATVKKPNVIATTVMTINKFEFIKFSH